MYFTSFLVTQKQNSKNYPPPSCSLKTTVTLKAVQHLIIVSFLRVLALVTHKSVACVLPWKRRARVSKRIGECRSGSYGRCTGLMGVMMLFSCSSNSVAAQKPSPHGSYMSVAVRIPSSFDFNPLRAYHTAPVRIPYSPTGRRAVTVVTHLDAICTAKVGEAFPFYFCVGRLDRSHRWWNLLQGEADDEPVAPFVARYYVAVRASFQVSCLFYYRMKQPIIKGGPTIPQNTHECEVLLFLGVKDV